MSHAAAHHDPQEVLREENKRFYTFINIAFILGVLTGIEIVIIYLPFASWVIWTVLLGLSLIKFVFVIMWFMHLIYDKRFLTILFMMGLLIAVFSYTALLFLFEQGDVAFEEINTAMTFIKSSFAIYS